MWQKTPIQNITVKIAKFPADIAKARRMPLIAVHSFQKPHLPSNGETSNTASTDAWSQRTPSPSSPCKEKSKNQERQRREHTQKPQAQQNDNGAHTQHHTRWTEMHSLHHKGNNSISTHCPHNRYPSTVRLWSSKTPALLLHSNSWPNYISNTLRPAKLRQKPSRTLPAPHHSCPQ